MLNLRKKGILFLAILLVIGTLAACSNKDGKVADPGADKDKTTDISSDTGKDTPGGSAKEKLSGTITMAGSTSMEKLAKIASEAFMEKYPDVMVSAEFIGSSAGIEAVLAGTVNIGNASRSLKDTEKSSGVVENIVAIDGIAIILDKNNKVTNLTKDQLIQIFTGEVNNWSQLGGDSQPIVVVGREAGSGTRGAFEELLKIEEQCKYANEINSTGGVMAKIASTPGAIGYVSLDIVDDTVAAAKIDEVEPTEENIKAGSYLLSRPFVMATKGEISAQSKEVQVFFDYLNSDEGKELIKSIGLITID
ncbi:phosphate transport system substrate-binding protein [Anaerotaenia torta]|uniref:phosphate ABC transporter substrate-binding protein n=1 Tax=Anaerotaenia torta TaxID=433293 RepID=UPI003D1BEAB3